MKKNFTQKHTLLPFNVMAGSTRHLLCPWPSFLPYYSFLFLDKKEAKNQGQNHRPSARSPKRLYFFLSFPLDRKGPKDQGRHHRSFPRPSKCLTHRSWSAFSEGKRQAPIREGQALSQPFANASPHVGRASAPNPVKSRYSRSGHQDAGP